MYTLTNKSAEIPTVVLKDNTLRAAVERHLAAKGIRTFYLTNSKKEKGEKCVLPN